MTHKSKTYLLFPKVLKQPYADIKYEIRLKEQCPHYNLYGQTIDGIKVVYKHKLFMASYK